MGFQCPYCGETSTEPVCRNEMCLKQAPTTPSQIIEGVKILPVYLGWTVDARLGEFRRVEKQGGVDAGIVFLDFKSEDGDVLLSEYIDTLDVGGDEFREILIRLTND